MRSRSSLCGAALVALTALSPEALAVMPPHVYATFPAHGGHLEGNLVLLKGYSLGYADTAEMKVSAVDGDKEPSFTTELACEWEGEGDRPGSTQQHCELKVTLEGLQQGKRYRLAFLETEIEFVVGMAPDPAPPPAEPTPPAQEPPPTE